MAKSNGWALKSYVSLHLSQFYLLLLQFVRQYPGSIAGILEVREESPGSIRRSTSENGSCRQKKITAPPTWRSKGEKVV